MLESILEKLQNHNALNITTQDVTEIEKHCAVEKTIDTGMAGPIKVLTIQDEGKKLLIEADQKGVIFVRLVKTINVQEFIDERLKVYEKMWDGCGCKVFYNEIWTPIGEEKNIVV